MPTNPFPYRYPRWTLFLAALVVSLPILLFGLPHSAHDAMHHTVWTRNFAEQFWGGDLYPRWLHGMNNGFGSPAFYYYPPMEGYLTALFYPLASVDPTGTLRLGLMLFVTLFLSGVTAYRWLSELTSNRRDLLWATLLYMVGPYHVAVDLYFRGAVAEGLTFVILPIIFLALHRITDRTGSDRAAGLLLLVIGLATLLVTHLISILMVLPFILIWILLLSSSGDRIRNLIRVGLAGLLAAGCAAIYLLPALTQIEWVQIDTMFDRLGDNFLPDPPVFLRDDTGGKTNMVVFSITLSFLLLPGLLILRSKGWGWVRGNRTRLFWFVMLFGSIVMCTPLSIPIWYVIEPLRRLQFPWRFMAMSTVALSPLLLLALREGPMLGRGPLLMRRLFSPVVWGAAILLFTGGILLYRYLMIDPLPDVDRYSSQVLMYSICTREYTPACSDPMIRRPGPEGSTFRSTASPLYVQGDAEGGNGSVAVGGSQDVLLTVRQPHDTLRIGLDRYYYPLWRAEADRGEVGLLCRGPEGILEAVIPPETSRVRIYMAEGDAERWGGRISLASILLLGLGSLLTRRRQPAQRAPRPASGRGPLQ